MSVAMQQSLCMGDMATITVVYGTTNGTRRLDIPREPPSGLSALRYSETLGAFTKALSDRQAHESAGFYKSADERIAHGKWLYACANAMESEAKMHRTLAMRIAGA